MKRFSPVTLISLGLTLLTVLAGGMTGNRSENYPTSDLSLGADFNPKPGVVSPTNEEGTKGHVPEDENGQRNPSTGRAGNHGSYDRNGGGHPRSVSVASIVAAPGKLGAILRDVRQAARIEVLESDPNEGYEVVR